MRTLTDIGIVNSDGGSLESERDAQLACSCWGLAVSLIYTGLISELEVTWPRGIYVAAIGIGRVYGEGLREQKIKVTVHKQTCHIPPPSPSVISFSPQP